MSKLIIGDSHIIRLRKTLPYDIPVDECYWGEEPYPKNYKIPTCDYEHLLIGGGLKEKVYFSAHKGKSAYSSSYFFNVSNPCIKKIVDEDMTIMPFFGYIDAKIQLVRYKNPEEAVVRYIDGFQAGFPKHKIQFIEPIPQFINNLGFGGDIFDFIDRDLRHKQFIYHLRKQCDDRGLLKPISPEEIFGVDKFDESYECHECDYCLSPEGVGVKFDHLKPEFNKMILDAIITEMI